MRTNRVTGQNLAEALGFERDAKLLIVHADDLGLSRSTNVAVMRAFEQGAITSGSIMVPCPWFADFAAYYRAHQPLDVGIHATLTAEWANYRWGGVLPATEIPSLLDEQGYLHRTVEEVAQHANPNEAERELRAQIERAIAFGIEPTHLDTHMGSVMARPELVDIYLELGKEFGLPVLVTSRGFSADISPYARSARAMGFQVLDGLYMMHAHDTTRSWSAVYGEMIEAIGPGLNQLIVHLSIDDAEMQAIAVDHPDFGSAWRQRDLDFVLSDTFQSQLAANDITLIGWNQIRAQGRSHN